MSDPRYQSGVIAGCANSITLGAYPDFVRGLGPRLGGQPFGRCIDCPPDAHAMNACGHVTYGGIHLCKRCANKRETESLA